MEVFRLVSLLVLLLLSAYFSSAETALFSLRKSQLSRLAAGASRIESNILQLLEQHRHLALRTGRRVPYGALPTGDLGQYSRYRRAPGWPGPCLPGNPLEHPGVLRTPRAAGLRGALVGLLVARPAGSVI